MTIDDWGLTIKESALDFAYRAAWLREYIGIAWDGPRVWTAFNGTSQFERGNKGLIWSSRIDWPGP